MPFFHSTATPEIILKFLQCSLLARPRVEQIRPQLMDGRIRLVDLSQTPKIDLSEKGAAGGVVFEDEIKVLYYDSTLELGAALTAWAHEIYHLTDPVFEAEHFKIQRLWSKMQGDILERTLASFSKKEGQQMLLQCQQIEKMEQLRILHGEKRAYDFQQKVIIELALELPEYQSYVEFHESDCRVFQGPLGHEELIRAYDLALLK